MFMSLKGKSVLFYTNVWVGIQTIFLFAYLMIFLGMEKWVDLASNSSISASANLSIIENALVFVLFCLGGKSRYTKLQVGLFLTVTLLAISIVQIDRLSYYGAFVLMALIAWLCYHFIPIMSVVLSRLLEASKRGKAVQSLATFKSLSQMSLVGLSYFLLTSYFSVRVYFGIALVLMLLVSFLLYILKPYFPDSPKVKEKESNLNTRSFSSVSGVMLIFGITYFGFRAYSLINRQYLGDVFGKPEYENVLLLTLCYLVGGFIVSLGAVKLYRTFSLRTSFVLASGILILFVAVVYFQLPLLFLHLVVVLMGIGNYGVVNALKIHVNENYEGDALYRQSRLFYVIPFLSSAICLFTYGKLTDYGLEVMLIAMIVVVSILLLFAFAVRFEKK